jgi:glycine/D-amino acid oxidase-like deaminating enzyme
MRVLICGGGVIGVAVAYYLSLRGAETVVIERTGIANAASGKSGGFLALDWCDGSRLAALARRSFALHAELAEVYLELGDDSKAVKEFRQVLRYDPDYPGAEARLRELEDRLSRVGE